MKKISVIYWSGTGNTQMMAEALASGAKPGGAEVKLAGVDDAGVEDVMNAAAGAPMSWGYSWDIRSRM